METIETTGTVVETQAPEVALLARRKLEKVLAQAAAQTMPVMERIYNEIPEDRVVPASRVTIAVHEDASIAFGSQSFDHRLLHKHATKQLLERLEMSTTDASRLLVPDGTDKKGKLVDNSWRRRLMAHNLNEHLRHADDKYLVRSVGDQVRGILSDSYRRLDSRPLLDAFIQGCQSLNLTPYEGVANDVRVSIRAILPTILEPVPGEYMVFGLEWRNSDFGCGKYDVRAFVLRLLCLNGMIGEQGIGKVHLGKRLAENIEFSKRTYELDTKTTVSETRDILKYLMGPDAVAARTEAVKEAHTSELSWAQGFRQVSKLLTKSEAAEAKEKFESDDDVLLPVGQTAWRMSNALSWLANKVDTAERKLELQAAAGKFVRAA